LRRAWSHLAVLTLAAVLALAGCGSRPGSPVQAAPPPPAAGPGHGLAFLDASRGWALVDCGNGTSTVPGTPACRLVTTADGGKTWTQAATGLPASARLQFFNAQDGFATVDGGTCAHGLCPAYVLGTTDGGRTWTTRYSGPVELASIDFSSPTAGWSIVDGGLDQSTDGGLHWHESVAAAQAIGTACTMDFVRFSTSEAGMAGGGSSGGPCLATTSDGGATWKLADGKPIRTGLQALNLQGVTAACAAADASPGWLHVTCDPASPGAMAVLRTGDGGATWTYAWGVAACLMGCRSDNAGMQPLFFLDASTVWRLAPRGAQRTTDEAATWTGGQPLCADPGCQVNLAFVTADRGWAVVADGQSLDTTADGGRTWTRQWPEP